eukprot:TRINITY_DN3604_c1_g1_i4.p1 TRINITY_DN3604_c1_g1~~TRINITY_DN3604_c1_g1_i4.p1  ORF type:complete len:253 (-),score=48.42 TRINITY_DN3604_c1_g1_i4:169-927(-)
MLYLRGRQFQTQEEISTLRPMIAQQLLSCPHSLIIMDEMQLLDRSTLAILQEFLDATVPYTWFKGEHVMINEAVWIFISDLLYNLKPDADNEEIEKLANEATLTKWMDLKQTSLLPFTVAFVSISKEPTRELVGKMISNLNSSLYNKIGDNPIKLRYDAEDGWLDTLADSFYERCLIPQREFMNYRCVYHFINEIASDMTTRTIKSLDWIKKQKKSYTITLTIKPGVDGNQKTLSVTDDVVEEPGKDYKKEL